MNRKIIIFSAVFVLGMLLSIHGAAAATYLEVYADGVVAPNGSVSVSGQIVNTSVSDTIQNVNVSATAGSNGGWGHSGPDGNFSFSVTAPSTVGNSEVTVITNESAPKSKVLPLYISNVTSGSVTYVSGAPPYSPSSTFRINVTLLNGSTREPDYSPDVAIFSSMGQAVSWTIVNNSVVSGANGVISYNITIPSDAVPGSYAIIVEKGAIFSVFGVKSGYVVGAVPKNTDGAVGLNYAPGSSVVILAKVKTVAGVAAASVASSVKAYITAPNGSTQRLTLNAMDQSAFPGYYNNTFTDTSASGDYNVRVNAVVSGTTYQGYTFFSVKSYNVRLEPQTDFFDEWGGSAAFGAGDTVGLNIVATNLTSEEFLTVPGDIPNCNASYMELWDVFFPNGTSVNSTITGAEFVTSRYLASQICAVKFTGPTVSSPYGIKVNVTIAGEEVTAKGYFSIEKYFLKPTTVAGFGGEMEKMDMVAPGENATITLSAYNITGDQALLGGNISNVVVKRIVPLEFSLGVREVTALNYSVSYGSTPTVTVTIPSTIIGPASVDIEATVAGETVRGNSFFIVNYLMGEMRPQIGGPDGGEGGGGEEEGGPPFSSCTGLQPFGGMIMEVKTNQAVSAGSVIINGIIEAREELTGKDVSSYISLSGQATSGNEGSISANLTFSDSYGFSGFYFVLFNATYQGKSSGIPAGFMCKKLNFWPETYSVGGSDATWRIAPNSGVQIIIANASRLNDSVNIRNATMEIPIIFNFNPGKGGETILTPLNSTLNWFNWTNASGQAWNVTSNFANFTVYPQNFTKDGTNPLTKWPSGFIDLQPKICTESLGGNYPDWECDFGFGGFQVVPFDAWIENYQWGGTTAVNSTQTYIISVKSNVSIGCTDTECPRNSANVYTGANNTGFRVKIGRPWEGELTALSSVTVNPLSDTWNSSGDMFGEEKWNLTFTVPATIKKGEAEIIIIVNNSYGETSDIFAFTTFTKYTITIPYEEGIEIHVEEHLQNNDHAQFIQTTGWNLSAVNVTLGIWSKSNRTCHLDNITVTRWQESSSTDLTYNDSVRIMVVDNGTSGIYDFVVYNTSDGTLGYASESGSNRALSWNAYGIPGIYIRNIEDCHYIQVINSTATSDADVAVYGALPSWGGQSQVGKLHVIPYIVSLGDNPVSGAQVHVNGMIEQNNEGFGFESKLLGSYDAGGVVADGENYSYIDASTDSSGVAFLSVNATPSGRFKVFWKVNTSEDDYDIATFDSGTDLELRKFKGWGDGTYWLPDASVTLYNTSGLAVPIWEDFMPGVFNGTITESGNYGFLRDDQVDTWYFAFNETMNLTCLDDDANMSDSDPDTGNYGKTCMFINETTDNFITDLGAEDDTRFGVMKFSNDSATQKTLVFYQESPRISSMTASGTNAIVTIKVCAETFDLPNCLKIEGALVKIFAMNYETMGPPESTPMTIYDPYNGTAYSGGASAIYTGPGGCVAFNMTHPTGWPSNKCTELQGTLTRGSDTENIWVGRVCS